MNILEEREIETHTTYNFYAARTAAIDAEKRGKIAAELHEDFFNDPAHIDRVEKTKTVVKAFWPGVKLYVNQRGLGTHSKRPFTVVKVERPLFPNHLTRAEKDAKFYAPLAELEVEIVFAKGSDSYLFRIR